VRIAGSAYKSIKADLMSFARWEKLEREGERERGRGRGREGGRE